MELVNSLDILRALLAATSNDEMLEIRREIGDPGNAELDQPFGRFKFCWHAFGDNPSNISSIGLGTKAGRSLTERITNATHAILEERVSASVPSPQSARAAAQRMVRPTDVGPRGRSVQVGFQRPQL